jgi:hypothetical protein
MEIWQNCSFGRSIIEVLQFAQLLALDIFESVSFVRENLRGLRENLKHKIRTLGGKHAKAYATNRPSILDQSQCFMFGIKHQSGYVFFWHSGELVAKNVL